MLYILGLAGVAVFAIAGALRAKQMNLDWFGVIVIGMVTSLGGGTLRDVMLGRTPVFWMRDDTYIIVAVSATILTFTLLKRHQPSQDFLLTADALGLGLFSIVGTEIGLDYGVSPLISIWLGVMTGTFGGLIRDVMLAQIPLILHREIYATAALVGATLYVLLKTLQIDENTALIVGVVVIFMIRMASIERNWQLPVRT